MENIEAKVELESSCSSGFIFPSGDTEQDLALVCRHLYIPGLNSDENPKTVYVQYIISEEMKIVAQEEGISSEEIRKLVATGRVVIPKNINHDFNGKKYVSWIKQGLTENGLFLRQSYE